MKDRVHINRSLTRNVDEGALLLHIMQHEKPCPNIWRHHLCMEVTSPHLLIAWCQLKVETIIPCDCYLLLVNNIKTEPQILCQTLLWRGRTFISIVYQTKKNYRTNFTSKIIWGPNTTHIFHFNKKNTSFSKIKYIYILEYFPWHNPLKHLI